MLKRHVFFYQLVRPLVAIFVRIKFGYRYQIAKNLPDTYIVLSNHTTDYDPLFVCASFPRQMYFVGSEHIARWNLAYKLLNFFFSFIIRQKGTTASSTVMEMLRRVRAGYNVCLFAEGNRSWDGLTCAILPSTGKVIRKAGCGLVTYRIEGGYFASPRWSGSNTRRGRVYGAPVNIYTAEQLSAMTVDEINHVITRDLFEDAYARQLADPVPYRGKRLAEHMEEFLFICPQCGTLDSMHSHDNQVVCKACNFTFRYTEYGTLEGCPYSTVTELSAWQNSQVEKAAKASAVYTAPTATLTRVSNHQEIPVAQGPLSLSAEELTCGDMRIELSSISDMAMHGKRSLVFSTPQAYYELVPAPGSNALKFLLLYTKYRKVSANNSVVTK